jgi:GTP pyrophosphokinase
MDMQDYDILIDNSVEELINNLKNRLKEEDLQRIRAAYELAKEAHKPQRRKSGEPYIIHPVAVARIVAEELELSTESIMAAFLHDVVEDTPYTIEDINDHFGEDVSYLVNVLTKKKTHTHVQGSSKQIDNFRQILASLEYDIRALLIKLADRLHNMRTLDSMLPSKQMKIAGETDYFYAPLANRLGLYHVKTELENLSFKYRCPKEYSLLEGMLEHDKQARNEQIGQIIAKIHTALDANELTARTELRWRMPHSVWRKMRSTNSDFNHVEGKHYIRIIYPDNLSISEKRMSLKIYSALTDFFKEQPGSVSNYIDSPRANGNQSFHVKILSDYGTWEEIHISSERMVRNSRLGCAAESREGNIMNWLDKFKSILEDAAHHSQEIDFMDGVTMSFYNEDIQAYTPKGKRIILPKGATALDFAYELHTHIGKFAKVAYINGKLTSLITPLKSGDCVEIGTDEEVSLHQDWVNKVVTYKAKRNMRTYFASKPKLDFIRCTECRPIPGDEVIGFKDDEGKIHLHRRNCPVAIKMASRHGDSILPVNFEESPDFMYHVRLSIRGIDRYHLFSDLVGCISEKLKLSMERVVSDAKDNVATCEIDFDVHSISELEEAIASISAIKGVEEVSRVSL